jgi:hypothetical protein
MPVHPKDPANLHFITLLEAQQSLVEDLDVPFVVTTLDTLASLAFLAGHCFLVQIWTAPSLLALQLPHSRHSSISALLISYMQNQPYL